MPPPRFLIDENLSVKLVEIARNRGYEAYHVAHYGLQSAKDWDLLRTIRDEDFILVTNNVLEFQERYEREAVHAGIVFIIPNVVRANQIELWTEALRDLARNPDLVNTALEVDYIDPGDDRRIVVRRYSCPS